MHCLIIVSNLSIEFSSFVHDFVTICPTHNIPMRRSYRLKASQGLNTKDMDPQLNNLFHVNVCASCNPTNAITYPHSGHTSHVMDESLLGLLLTNWRIFIMNLRSFNRGWVKNTRILRQSPWLKDGKEWCKMIR